MSMQQFCLRWNNHQPNFISVFSSLLNSASLVDVTLAAEGRHLQAHKVVLSACSSYFQSLFTVNPCQHPIVILKDVKFADLKVMVDFMYYGEVNVSQEQLPHILKTAEMLKIKGLAEMPDSTSLIKSQSGSSERAELLTPGDSNWSSDLHRRSLSPSPCPLSPNSRRKRLRKSSTGSGSGSTERTSEDHPGCEHGHGVIKPDPGFSSDCSTTPQRAIKQHSSTDSEHRDSSQESGDGDVILQIPTAVQQQHQAQQSDNMEHSLVELTCPSSTSGSGSHPSSASGLQWAFLDHSTYHPRIALSSCPLPPPPPPSSVGSHADAPYTAAGDLSCALAAGISVTGGGGDHTGLGASPCHSMCRSPCDTSPQAPQPPSHLHGIGSTMKRKRTVNPQGDENFVRALEAVRFGGIGFCKAARMYGVNNRTLWLEYKKRGYPVSRLSIKSRSSALIPSVSVLPLKMETSTHQQQSPHIQQSPHSQQSPHPQQSPQPPPGVQQSQQPQQQPPQPGPPPQQQQPPPPPPPHAAVLNCLAGGPPPPSASGPIEFGRGPVVGPYEDVGPVHGLPTFGGPV